MPKLIAAALALLSGTATAQPLTYLTPDADSPIAYQCLVAGTYWCSVPVIPFCERHKAQLMFTPMAQVCVRAERIEALRRSRIEARQ